MARLLSRRLRRRPLFRLVLYLGQWAELSGATGMGALEASTLWLAAVPAIASQIVTSIRGRTSLMLECSGDRAADR